MIKLTLQRENRKWTTNKIIWCWRSAIKEMNREIWVGWGRKLVKRMVKEVPVRRHVNWDLKDENSQLYEELREDILSRGRGRHKDLEVGMSLVFLRTRKEANVTQVTVIQDDLWKGGRSPGVSGTIANNFITKTGSYWSDSRKQWYSILQRPHWQLCREQTGLKS